MKTPVVDHIGIVVEDLDKTLLLFKKMFGLKPGMKKEMPDVGLRIAQLNAANIEIELLEYTGVDMSFAKKVMGSGIGLNHFSVRVNDMSDTLNSFEKEGIKVKGGFPRQGAHGKVAFFEPETTAGILMEVCQV